MIRFLFNLSLILLLTGCARSTGVIPFGPDTYTITTDNELGGMGAAKKRAIQDANAYCSSSGKKMMPVSTYQSSQKDPVGDRIPTYELTFRCLATGDEDLKRPNPEQAHDIIIETK